MMKTENKDKRLDRVIDTVYYIHENTRPIQIAGQFKQIATDYVVAKGFKYRGSDEIYIVNEPDTGLSIESDQFLYGVTFKTYEEGEKVLLSILKEIMFEYSDKIKHNFDKLKEKYPEMLI